MELKVRPYVRQDGLSPAAKRRRRLQNYGAEKEADLRRKKKEERLNKLKEYGSPEKQRITPRPQDRLRYFSKWHFSVVLVGVVVLILGLFALIAISQGRNNLGREVSRLLSEQTRLKETNNILRARIEELVILEDLEIIALEDLNLQIPTKGQIYVLE